MGRTNPKTYNLAFSWINQCLIYGLARISEIPIFFIGSKGIPVLAGGGVTVSYNRIPANIHVYEKDIDTIGFWRAIMRSEINVNDGESVEKQRPSDFLRHSSTSASECLAQHVCLAYNRVSEWSSSVAGTESILKHCFNGQGHKSLSIVLLESAAAVQAPWIHWRVGGVE